MNGIERKVGAAHAEALELPALDAQELSGDGENSTAASEAPGTRQKINQTKICQKRDAAASCCSPAAYLQESEPGVYCDMRECSSGMRRRSTHLFSQRSPGDVGQDEQDSVSWGDAANRFQKLQQSSSAGRE